MDKQLPTPEIQSRLIKGAKFLGKLWKEGTRCPEKFVRMCSCDERNRFCRARDRFLELTEMLVDRGARGVSSEEPSSPFWMITNMELEEFDALGLHITVDTPTMGRIDIDSSEALELIGRLRSGDTLTDKEESNIKQVKEFFTGKRVGPDDAE